MGGIGHFIHSDYLAHLLPMVCCGTEDPWHMPASDKSPEYSILEQPYAKPPSSIAGYSNDYHEQTLKQETRWTCSSGQYVDMQASDMQTPQMNLFQKDQHVASCQCATGNAGQASGRAAIYNFIQTVQNRKHYIAPQKRENSTYVICVW